MTFYHLGLLGYPLGHSYSPLLHQAGLNSMHLAGKYELFSIPPSTEENLPLRHLLARLRSGELDGLNITIPYKTTILPYIDELTPVAKASGAVNAILVRDGRLVGANFDCQAFLDDLKLQLKQAGRCDLGIMGGRRAAVLGAGGAARAVIAGLLAEGWEIKVAARRVGQACELVEAFSSPHLVPSSLDGLENLRRDGIDLLVNATPLGMHPEICGCAWPGSLPLPPHVFVYDLVYNPRETALLGRARQAGLAAVNGLGMLARQAAMSQEAWTGKLPDWQEMYDALVSERVDIRRG